MTTQFFTDRTLIGDTHLRLNKEDSQHARRTLRKEVGDIIEVSDGVGGWYKAKIELLGKKELLAEILEQKHIDQPFQLSIGLGLLKNSNRLENFLEKATELGVTDIYPLKTQRTQKVKLRPDRISRILIAAMKQSGRSWLPRFHDTLSFKDVLDKDSDRRFICHEVNGHENLLSNQLSSLKDLKSITILIGPEGGFTDQEIDQATTENWELTGLGSLRLRAETAAMLSAGVAMLALTR